MVEIESIEFPIAVNGNLRGGGGEGEGGMVRVFVSSDRSMMMYLRLRRIVLRRGDRVFEELFLSTRRRERVS